MTYETFDVPVAGGSLRVGRWERGILDQEPPLYPDVAVQPWLERLPTLRTVMVDGVNHYTIALAERGAKAVAEVTRRSLGA